MDIRTTPNRSPRSRFLTLLAALAAIVTAQAQPARAQTDDLKVTLCGTSGPLPVRDRAKPCVAVQAGGSLYLVDVGPEATENLLTWRMPLATAKAVFITHLHSDHIGEVGEFNMQSWVAGRPQPLVLVGPPGTADLAAGYNLAYRADHGFRNAHHEHDAVKLPIATGLLTARTITLPAAAGPGGVRKATAWTDGALTVTAIQVAHDPVKIAYAYRFDYKGRSVVVSGDTRKWPPLAEAAKGADVLIHEAQNSDMTKMMAQGLKGLGNARLSSVMTDTLSYHTTPVEAAEIAKAAGVKRLVYTHLTQAGLPFYTPEAFTAGVAAVGGPDWRLARDGMTITLPANSADIVFGQQQ
jgi:ribonuclease Z